MWVSDPFWFALGTVNLLGFHLGCATVLLSHYSLSAGTPEQEVPVTPLKSICKVLKSGSPISTTLLETHKLNSGS